MTKPPHDTDTQQHDSNSKRDSSSGSGSPGADNSGARPGDAEQHSDPEQTRDRGDVTPGVKPGGVQPRGDEPTNR